ncbi:alpha/beta fold hydrolase [Bounagaea algeriensis]
MPLHIAELLRLVSRRAFDIDPAGRVLAGSDESGSVQLVEIDAADEPPAARQLTALPGSVTGRYLPDRRAVVVQHDTDGDERTQLSLLPLEPDATPATSGGLTPLVRNARYVHRLVDVLPGRVVYTTNRRNGVDFDVVVHEVDSGAEHVVHAACGMVGEAATAPDGRVAITVPAAPALSEQLLLVDTAPAGAVHVLTGAAEHARHTRPGWTDRGELLVTSNAGRDRTGIARVAPGGEHRWLVPDADGAAGTDGAADTDGADQAAADPAEHDLTGWVSPDGSTLLVHTNADGTSRLSLHDTADGRFLRPVRLPGAGWCAHPLPEPVFSPDGRWIALSWSSASTPGDVLLVDSATGRGRALTSSAGEHAAALAEPALAEPALAEPAQHRVPARDGQHIPCLVYRRDPGDTTDPTVRGSAVVMVHGGPEGQSVRTFNPVAQALAARGHTVVLPNVRGSTGYGKQWYSADDRRARMSAVDDLADVHAWLPEIGCDTGRAALWGGSYGGYMVLAGLAFQPGRWAAGVDIVGISSLLTFLANTAPYRRAHREREYGSPREDAEFLRSISPLHHAGKIRAPLFALHGANDPRVPLSEAEQIAASVRRNGVECELVVYGDEGHGLARRGNRLDAYPRALEFLARHLAL